MILEQLRFAEPEWLFLFFLIPVLIWANRNNQYKTPKIRFPTVSKLKNIDFLGKAKFMWILPLLRYTSLFFITIALARPQIDRSTHVIQSSGVDIVLAVDLSASMLALDMSENKSKDFTRLDVVKEVLQGFIQKRKHDRIGIVAFSVNPYLVSALTLDREHLQRNLARLRVGLTH